jgi:hypothetical protein
MPHQETYSRTANNKRRCAKYVQNSLPQWTVHRLSPATMVQLPPLQEQRDSRERKNRRHIKMPANPSSAQHTAATNRGHRSHITLVLLMGEADVNSTAPLWRSITSGTNTHAGSMFTPSRILA